jgi:hypothetical protein
MWLSGLPGKARRRTLDGLKTVYASSPFPVRGFHGDNGPEFISRDTIGRRRLTGILLLTRSRPYHKNDNCFAEQKNCQVLKLA